LQQQRGLFVEGGFRLFRLYAAVGRQAHAQRADAARHERYITGGTGLRAGDRHSSVDDFFQLLY
jgi:hypothetical protein